MLQRVGRDYAVWGYDDMVIYFKLNMPLYLLVDEFRFHLGIVKMKNWIIPDISLEAYAIFL